ncbi:MAG: hypothetical protein ACXVLQ_14365 [Bacteriovorax sp.]
MKTRRPIDIAIAAITLAFIGFYVYNHYLSPPKKKRTVAKITKANDILKYKTVIRPSILNATVTSSACTLFLKNSAESSMNDYANEFIDHHVDAILKTCAGAIPSGLQLKIDEAVLKCKTSSRQNITPECYSALMGAKTKSVATIVKPDVNPRELDSTILLHLIADGFSSGDFLEHPERNLAIVDALLEKEPSYLSGYKVKLLLLAMSSLNKEERYREMFQETLDEAIDLKSNDRDLLEIFLAEKGNVFKKSEERKESKDYIEFLDQESAKYPKEWLYDYYKANALYNDGLGNYDQTVALIEGALKKAPNENRLKQTLENLKSDDENKRKHPFVISIGFSLNDL